MCLQGNSTLGWQMDTTCNEVVSEDSINFSNSYSNIRSIEGIRYFDNLKVLYCGQQSLTFLPTLPNNLTYLLCTNNQLTALPALPNSLTYLNCSFNDITSLPTLPNSLVHLACVNNNLTSLPSLSNSLVKLFCQQNQLTSLPTLPNSITELNIEENLITSLPSLPDSLYWFDCDYNPSLSCLPKLGIVNYLFFTGTSITCLPNYPEGNILSGPPLNSVPLCGVFNANGCDVFYNISGTVFGDSIQNCVKDTIEKTFKNSKLLLYRNNDLEQQSIANNFGQYSFETDLDTFEIRIDTTGLPYQVACPANGKQTVILTPQDSIKTNIDFGLRCKTSFDVGVLSAVRDSGMLFPAQQAGIHVTAGDLSKFYGLNCAAGVSGAVNITYSGPVSFAGVMSGALAPVVSGNTLTYSIADFGAIDMQTAFGLRFLVDTFAQIGQQLCLNVVVTPTAGDNNVSNNTATYCFEIVNSYDPNMKEVSPINTIAPDEDWLTYTIHFQNMGNAPAIHIYVMDTLDSNLDESSIQILGSSHRMLTEIKGKFARFNFPNINLIDSATNEPESKGWLQYKIKKKTNLALGTQIKNTASIYFDFNAPVVTNTVTNTVAQPSAVSYIRHPTSDIRLFPNPTSDVVYVSYNSNTSADVTLFNINGAACLKQQLSASNQSISLSDMPAGVYFISVEIGGSVVRKKVVKW